MCWIRLELWVCFRLRRFFFTIVFILFIEGLVKVGLVGGGVFRGFTYISYLEVKVLNEMCFYVLVEVFS